VKKFKNVAGESIFDKVAMYAMSCLALTISNADGTTFLNCNFNINNIRNRTNGAFVRYGTHFDKIGQISYD